MVSILASGPSCPWFDSQHSPKHSQQKFSMLLRLINLVETEQWLKFADPTLSVLAGGKLVLQKKLYKCNFVLSELVFKKV